MNHEKLLDTIISEPDDWLWNPAIDHEIMVLLPDLWDALDEVKRKDLEAVLDGPSSDSQRVGIRQSRQTNLDAAQFSL